MMGLPLAANGLDITGELFVAGGIILTAALGWIGTVIARRVRGRSSEPEMWRRLDELSLEVYGGKDADGVERKGLKAEMEEARRLNRAQGFIIRALVRQWPDDGVPLLDPNYLAEIDEDTIPADHPFRSRPDRRRA